MAGDNTEPTAIGNECAPLIAEMHVRTHTNLTEQPLLTLTVHNCKTRSTTVKDRWGKDWLHKSGNTESSIDNWNNLDSNQAVDAARTQLARGCAYCTANTKRRKASPVASTRNWIPSTQNWVQSGVAFESLQSATCAVKHPNEIRHRRTLCQQSSRC